VHGSAARALISDQTRKAIALTAASLLLRRRWRISRPCRRASSRSPKAFAGHSALWECQNDERQETGVLAQRIGYKIQSRLCKPRSRITSLHDVRPRHCDRRRRCLPDQQGHRRRHHGAAFDCRFSTAAMSDPRVADPARPPTRASMLHGAPKSTSLKWRSAQVRTSGMPAYDHNPKPAPSQDNILRIQNEEYDTTIKRSHAAVRHAFRHAAANRPSQKKPDSISTHCGISNDRRFAGDVSRRAGPCANRSVYHGLRLIARLSRSAAFIDQSQSIDGARTNIWI